MGVHVEHRAGHLSHVAWRESQSGHGCLTRDGIQTRQNALHRVIALRNAFAHHSSNAHPVFVVGRTPEESTNHLQFWVLEGSGKVSRVKRAEAFTEFNAAYLAVRESLVQLKNMVHEKLERSDA